jgi:hypothetical protein
VVGLTCGPRQVAEQIRGVAADLLEPLADLHSASQLNSISLQC